MTWKLSLYNSLNMKLQEKINSFRGTAKELKEYKKKVKFLPCRKCGSTDISIHDCGYSSFNPGSIKCDSCGHFVKVNDVDSLHPEFYLIKCWNNDKPTLEEMEKHLKEIDPSFFERRFK